MEKAPDTLRVQDCAFGGMFCGGQTLEPVELADSALD
jgi:hypothetical protein